MFPSRVMNLQLAVCAEELGIHYTYIILTNKGTATKALLLLFVRLAKRSRVFNSLVTEQAATDSAHFFASSVGWAQPTLVVGCPPAARSLAIAGGWQVLRSGVINLQLAVGPRNSGFIPHNWRAHKKHTRFYTSVNVSSPLTHSYSGIQPPIQPIFSLAAWGGHSPRWRCVAGSLRAL